MRRLDVLRFPSPIGELHFSIFFCFSFPLPVSYCFRPLSGSYISQSERLFPDLWSMIVSVPYRGATFLNFSTSFLSATQQRFPSPIGELHFSISQRIFFQLHSRGFRPLSGSYISQLELGILYSGNSIVSVPYRGATFLNSN